MIDKSNLLSMLETLGFKKENGALCMYSYSFGGTLSNKIVVDFQNEKIIYPEGLDTGDNTTTNFSHNENFVVLECVFQLLKQGYEPNTIFLEKAWTLGHTAKSGRADITVFKNFKKGDDDDAQDNYLPYLIIECKTAGSEYKSARNELFDDPDGKQLFSYFCQARSVQWLQLYASDYDKDKKLLSFSEEVIKTLDDDNVLAAAQLDDTILTFKNASEAKDAFVAWEETYAKESYRNKGLIIGPDAQPYNIGVKPVKRKDLLDLHNADDSKSIVDKFREILRHNSVSDKENAFNKLLSLFICKFVDEDTHQNPDDIMEFQYVEGSDNYYSLYEKLLNLFNKGMKEYLKEEVFYLGKDYISNTLQQYAKKKRKNLQEVLEESFQKTKMLSCQVFAFKEVYNEKLFAQNGKILVEMVRLLQDYSFSGTGDKQLLGDLFENLLNQGFKQEAGQFFTPIPITRFLWNSLPLEKYIVEHGYKVPKTIDFACGSGHFLTEGIAAIKDSFRRLGIEKTDAEISSVFYGTEKDNRLARVSKVALLFNGATKANIYAADGLEHEESELGRLNSFDILVANPPYSVSEFKKHVSRKVQRAYKTIELMTNQCGDIQNVFSERMQHLLDSHGLAAIILPSSYLNTKNEADILTRELLVKNFYIKAIANFNDKTFSDTNTTTVVLFLERRSLDVKEARISKDSVDAILNLEDLAGWVDEEIFDEYLNAISADKASYNAFWTDKHSVLDSDKFVGYFKEYRDYYVAKSTKEIEKIDVATKLGNEGKLKKNQSTAAELAEVLNRKFYEWVKTVEEDKILIMSLTYNQNTLILNAPKDNAEQEAFLGYSFSKRRGDEGIKESEGFLTNKADRCDTDKIAYIVREALKGNFITNQKYDKYFNVVKTSDMFNFAGPVFDKAIKTSVEKKFISNSKWPLVKLGDVAPYVTERIDFADINVRDYVTTDNMLQNREGVLPYEGQPSIDRVIKYQAGDILVSNIRPYLQKIWYANKQGGCNADVLVFRTINKDVSSKYLYNVMSQDLFFDFMMDGKKGLKMPRGNKDSIPNFTIPHPPHDIQAQIVSECEAIDKEFENSKKTIEESRAKIEEIMNNVEGEKKKIKEVCDINKYTVNPINNPEKEFVYVDIDAIENGLGTYSLDKKILGKSAPSRARRYATSKSTLISTVRPNLKGFAYIENEIMDAVYSTGFAILNSKDSNVLLDKLIYYYFMFSSDLMNQMVVAMPKGQYPSINKTDIDNFSFPVPSLPEQERIVKLVEDEEKKINDAKAVMASAKERKQAVLDKYL